MSAVNGLLKAEALKKMGELATRVSVGENVGAEKAATGDVAKKGIKMAAGHELVVDDIIYVEAADANTLTVGRFYFIKASAAEEVTLSQQKGGVQEEWTGTITAATKFFKIRETKVKVGGVEERQPTNWEAPVNGVMIDKTPKAFKIPGAAGAGKIVVTYLMFWDKAKLSEGGECKAVNKVTTPETFESEQTYTINEEVWDNSKTSA